LPGGCPLGYLGAKKHLSFDAQPKEFLALLEQTTFSEKIKEFEILFFALESGF